MNSEQLSLYFFEFSTICYGFLKFTVLKKETKHCTEAPGKIWCLAMQSLAELGAGEARRPKSGGCSRRRRGNRGGRASGSRKLPQRGFGWGGDGRRRLAGEEEWAAEALLGGGGALVMGSGRGRAYELQGGARKLTTAEEVRIGVDNRDRHRSGGRRRRRSARAPRAEEDGSAGRQPDDVSSLQREKCLSPEAHSYL